LLTPLTAVGLGLTACRAGPSGKRS